MYIVVLLITKSLIVYPHVPKITLRFSPLSTAFVFRTPGELYAKHAIPQVYEKSINSRKGLKQIFTQGMGHSSQLSHLARVPVIGCWVINGQIG